MDSSAPPRRRQKNGAVPARPPATRLRRERHAHQNSEDRQLQAATATADAFHLHDGFETHGHRRIDTVPTIGKQSVEEGERQRNFAVVNVGAGGVLYLKPSRMGETTVTHAPATPPATADPAFDYYTDRLVYRESNASGTWTPRARSLAVAAFPEPELTLENANAHERRRHRSQSCSTIGDPNELSKLAPTRQERARRRRSFTDSQAGPGNFLDLKIPHYRLGTPRFSDLGTAYLHNSVYTISTLGGVPSSVISQAEYDSLFAAGPGRGSVAVGGPIYLHPPRQYARSSTITRSVLASTRPSTVGVINPALFDKLERHLGDPAVVRYHPTTGRIMAATPARLIAQITSPQFLDYELLADFFLTFRCFMPCRDVLDYLFARMRWAFADGTDAGRIARVRTFVALRHWILNYFTDDFMKDDLFRQNFCDLVNELTRSLRDRGDAGGGDINIIGELKKCWRRTCALYWPIPDALESNPDADIVPGGIPDPAGSQQSILSLPLTIRPTNERASIFEMTQIQLPDVEERTRIAWASEKEPVPGNGDVPQLKEAKNRDTVLTNRTASIPASPMSEASMEVLSCSVPFLRHIRLRPSARAREKPETPQSRLAKAVRPTHTHKRSGSFSDALRDHRTPLSSPKADNIELKDLPSFAITGGLVRGILLQPSPAKVDSNIPVTPGPEMNEPRHAGTEAYLGSSERHNHIGVKRFVGEVRRALSSRKAGSSSTSPARTLHSASLSGSRGGSRGSDRSHRDFKPQPDWQQLGGPPRLDMLGAKIENAYKDAREEVRLSKLEPAPVSKQEPEPEQDPEKIELPPSEEPGTPRPGTAHKDVKDAPRSAQQSFDAKDFGRLNSHVTTGSRSIVIVDATGAPELPPMTSGATSSLGAMSLELAPTPLFRDRQHFGLSIESRGRDDTAHSDQGTRWQSPDSRLHSLMSGQNRWSSIDGMGRSSDDTRPRTSSLVLPSGVYIPKLPNQIRRMPRGDDLKATDRVHDLEHIPRPHSEGTFSAATQSITASTALFVEPDGGLQLPLANLHPKPSVSLLHTHSSQPDLRDSFKSEVRRLKDMPDQDSDGGIEDTLLRLEGKIPSPSYSTFSGGSNSERRDDLRGQTPIMRDMSRPILQEMPNGELREVRMLPVLKQMPDGSLIEVDISEVDMAFSNPGMDSSTSVLDNLASPMTETQGASIFHLSGSFAPSRYSKSPFPVHLTPTSEHRTTMSSSSSSSNSQLAVPGAQYSRKDRYSATSTPESFTRIQKPASAVDDDMSNGHYPSFKSNPWPGYTASQSFLLDDDETLSDISTEIADPLEGESGVRSFYFDDTGDEDPLPIQAYQPFDTPPSTAGANFGSPDRRQLLPRIGPRHPKQTLKSKISQPTLQEQAANQPFPRRDGNDSRQRGRTSPESIVDTSSHMPFVLAFESEVIAEQLTIIEKDALDEVDWKDLISLNWQQSPPTVRNWVDYLNRETANGIDIVIARFNLVVKWCVSEVVLTELPSERARAITKYIHIASHCHRLHNYASLYQITLALLSTDLARLKKTWSLVALREKQMLEHLEHLCRPLRNFHNLRAEMETAMPGNGIIPFIGLYTHDLMFNALKSARINSPAPDKEPLVNFERYQTAAMIVKNLLRLTEASSRYNFRPDPEALSRCLWIAALSDQEIDQRSRALEQSS